MTSAETQRILSYLDGELKASASADFEAKAAQDDPLANELAAYRSLFARLRALEVHRPRDGFAPRVLAGRHVQPRGWARARAWLARSDSFVLDPFAAAAEGTLPARQAQALAAYATRDPEAAAAMASSQRLVEDLGRLPVFQPEEGFAERVVSRVRRSPRPLGLWEGAATWMRRSLWPREGRRLAFVSGAAMGPVAVVAATAYLVLSRPLVTLPNLAAFAWTKASGAFSGVAEAMFGAIARSPLVREAYGALDGSTAVWLSAAALGLCVVGGLGMISAWVLYKNVAGATEMDGEYASV